MTAGGAILREYLEVGHTLLTVEECEQIIHDMIPLWYGSSYSLLNKNCNYFIIEVLHLLGSSESLPL